MIRCICILWCATILVATAAVGGSESARAWLPEGVRVSASVNPTRMTIGDRILYTLTVTAPEGIEIARPSVPGEAGGFRIMPLGLRQGKGTISYLYDLRMYETGEKLIPAPVVVVKNRDGRTASLSPGTIPIVVESVLSADSRDIRDIKPPLELGYIPMRLFVWVLIGAALVAGAAILFLRRMRERKVAAPPLLPPHLAAYAELDRLLAMNLISQGRVKEYYIRLSDIVRRYIEGRFGLKAPDRTTEEFLAEAGASGLLDARARTLVGDFLEQCDMVKFAQYGPTGDEITGAHAAAKRFVDETAPVRTKD